jgi:NADH-quinone oxidoreductase subunit A
VTGLAPLLAYAAAVIALVSGLLALSYALGQRHHERATAQPYESGMLATGTARVRISIGYYLVAVFFVLFDLEAGFLFAWAVAARRLGWQGWAAAMIFIGLLGAALVYLWRGGALEGGGG